MHNSVPITFEKVKKSLLKFSMEKTILVASFVFWVFILYINPYYLADLGNAFSDHLRHEWVAWLFLNVGFNVFSTPLEVFRSQVFSLNPHPYWSVHPTIYPLGNVLYFIPYGLLSNLGIVNDVAVHKLMVFSFLIGAHVSVYYFIQELKRLGYSFRLFLMVLFTCLFYTHMVFWSLNGFYDVVAVLLILLSIKYYKDGAGLKGLVVLTGAFFLHYRSIFYLPLWIFLFVQIVSEYKKDMWRQFTRINEVSLSFVWFLSVASLDCYTAFLSFVDRTWEIPTGWHPSIVNMYCGRLDALIMLITVSAIVFLILMKRKSYVTVATLVLCLGYTILAPQWTQWHHLFFFPALLLPTDKTSVEIVSVWLLFTIFLTTGFISPLHISELLQNMF